MVRSEIIGKLAATYPHHRRSVLEAAVDTMLNEVMETLAQGKRVELRGFGSFASGARKARMGRNPRSGEAVPVESKHVPRFKASKFILERLNATKK